MKPAFVIFAAALAIGCFAAGHQANAQDQSNAQEPPKTSPSRDDDCVIVRIENNVLWVNGSEPSGDGDLESWLKAARKGLAGKRRPELLVLANAEADYELVAMALQAGRATGFRDVKLATFSGEANNARVDGDEIGHEREGVADELSAARERQRKAEQRLVNILTETRGESSQPARGAEKEGRKSLRAKLRPLVEESFDARQRLRLEELKELRSRLAEIEQAVVQREKHKVAIIHLRVEELMNTTRSSSPVAPAEASKFKPQPLSNQELQETVPEANSPLPAGMETRVVRYVQEQVEINGEVKTVTRPVIEYRSIPGENVPQYRPPLADSSPEPRAETNAEQNIQAQHGVEAPFDFNTREQLAQLELESAEAEHAAVEKELDRLRKLHKQRAIEDSVLGAKEREHREAEFQLKRARLNLEGLARQRAELQAAAEAEVAEAEAEVRRVEAKVDVAKTGIIAAKAQFEKLEADAEGAAATYAHDRKVFERLHQLATVQKAVDMKLVDEKEGEKLAAEAALASAKSALKTGKAEIIKTEAAVAEVVEELNVAKERLRAAQARRDRLKPGDAPNAAEADSSESVLVKPDDKERN